MFDGRDFKPQPPEASQLGLEVAPVDFEREVMQRRRLDVNRVARIRGKRNRQRLLEEADDLGVPAVPIGDLEERDAIELLENIEADDVGVETLDRCQVLHAEDGLAKPAKAGVHGAFVDVRIRSKTSTRLTSRSNSCLVICPP